MTIEDDIAKQLADLEQIEAENLETYMRDHPEEFASTWTPTAERWRNGQQARARGKQKQRAYERKKQKETIEAITMGYDSTLSDKRIKRIKVYKIQVKDNKQKEIEDKKV